jgi:hypothetical protein
MPDYAPSFGKPQSLTFIAGAAITGGQLLYFTAADTVSPTAGATGAIAGVAGHDAATGALITVHAGAGVVHETPSTGLLAPPAPVLATAASGGTVLAGVYQVATSYVNAAGETTTSLVATITTTGAISTITIPSPPAALGSTGWYAYVSQVGGTTLTRQQAPGVPTAIGTPLVLSAPPTSSGVAPPAGNTSSPVAGALLAAAAGGQVTGGAAAGSEIGVAIRAESLATGNLRWMSRKF